MGEAQREAIESLEEVASALKRSERATKWALQSVRQAQARLAGIDVTIHTRPEGGRSDPAANQTQGPRSQGGSRAA